MTFRRFEILGYVDFKTNEDLFYSNPREVLFNLRNIQCIYYSDIRNKTVISTADGTLWLSGIEYQHLADALDGRGD